MIIKGQSIHNYFTFKLYTHFHHSHMSLDNKHFKFIELLCSATGYVPKDKIRAQFKQYFSHKPYFFPRPLTLGYRNPGNTLRVNHAKYNCMHSLHYQNIAQWTLE